MNHWKQRVRHLKRETFALYFACKDPRVPWYAKVFTAGVVGYAFSPIDLIPDYIPVLGYLDDLILLPLGILLAIRMIPPIVMEECRTSAESIIDRPVSRVAAVVIVSLWILTAGFFMTWVLRRAGR